MLYFKFYRGKGQKIKFSAVLLMILLSGDYRGKGQKIKFSAVLLGFCCFFVVFLFVNFYTWQKGENMKQKFLYDEQGHVYNRDGIYVGRLCLCVETRNGFVKIQNKKQFRLALRK